MFCALPCGASHEIPYREPREPADSRTLLAATFHVHARPAEPRHNAHPAPPKASRRAPDSGDIGWGYVLRQFLVRTQAKMPRWLLPGFDRSRRFPPTRLASLHCWAYRETRPDCVFTDCQPRLRHNYCSARRGLLQFASPHLLWLHVFVVFHESDGIESWPVPDPDSAQASGVTVRRSDLFG